jgi:hypothetical protein
MLPALGLICPSETLPPPPLTLVTAPDPLSLSLSHRFPHLVQVNTTAATHPAFVAAAPEAQVDYRP